MHFLYIVGLPPVVKNFYKEHEDVANMSEMEVAEFRYLLHLLCRFFSMFLVFVSGGKEGWPHTQGAGPTQGATSSWPLVW